MVLRKILITLLALAVLLPACGDDDEPEEGLPNPASVFCIEQGGTLEIREGDGGQSGFCVFPDGSECEEWAYYLGDCAPAGAGLANPASVYCIEQGGTLEMREGDEGQFGVCRFDDGSECEEWAFFRGECTPGG